MWYKHIGRYWRIFALTKHITCSSPLTGSGAIRRAVCVSNYFVLPQTKNRHIRKLRNGVMMNVVQNRSREGWLKSAKWFQLPHSTVKTLHVRIHIPIRNLLIYVRCICLFFFRHIVRNHFVFPGRRDFISNHRNCISMITYKVLVILSILKPFCNLYYRENCQENWQHISDAMMHRVKSKVQAFELFYSAKILFIYLYIYSNIYLYEHRQRCS